MRDKLQEWNKINWHDTWLSSNKFRKIQQIQRSTTQMTLILMMNRELTLKCKLKCYVKPTKNPLGVSPSKGYQGITRGKEKILMTSVGIEPTTSGLDLPLLCRLSYEVGQRKSGTIKVVNRGEEKVRVHINVVHNWWNRELTLKCNLKC